MGNQSSSGGESSFVWCSGVREKTIRKDSVQQPDSSFTLNLSTIAVKSEESILIEKGKAEMAKLDKVFFEGQISADEYAPKVHRIDALISEAAEAKRYKNSPAKRFSRDISRS